MESMIFLLVFWCLHEVFIILNLRRKISTKKFPLPQVGSKTLLSMREISGSHKSHICRTISGGVNTSPNFLTRDLDLINFCSHEIPSGTTPKDEVVAEIGASNEATRAVFLLLASCFLLLASCFLLLASCFLLLASCFYNNFTTLTHNCQTYYT